MSSNDGNDDRSGAKRPLESGAEEPGNCKRARAEFSFCAIDVDAPVVVPARQASGGFTFGVVPAAAQPVPAPAPVAAQSVPAPAPAAAQPVQVPADWAAGLVRKPVESGFAVITTCNKCWKRMYYVLHSKSDNPPLLCEMCSKAQAVQAVAEPVQAVAEPVQAVQASAGSGSGDARSSQAERGDAGSSAAGAGSSAGGERGVQMRQYDCPKCGQQHFEARNKSNPVWRKFNAEGKKHCAECKDRVECIDATCAVCVPAQSAAGVVAGGAQAGAGPVQAGAGVTGPVRVENGTPKFSNITLYCKNCEKTIRVANNVPWPGDDICNLCKTTGHVVRTYTYTCPDCKITHKMEKPAKSTVDDPYKAAIMGRPYCQRCRLFSSCDNPTTCGCPRCGKAARADFAINAALVAARAAQAGAGGASGAQAGAGSASAVQAGAGNASGAQAGAGGAGSGASGEKSFKAHTFIRSVPKAAIGKWDISSPLDQGINTNINRVPVVERRILYRQDEYIHVLCESQSKTVLKVSKLEKTVTEQAQKLEAQAKELEELRRIVDELRKRDGDA